MRFRLLLAALIWFFVGALGRCATAAEVRRVAVVVGSNLAPPGRVPLRYAHEERAKCLTY